MQEIPLLGWERFGSLGGSAPRLLGPVVRVLWLALNPHAGFSGLPHGWAQHRFALPVRIVCGAREAEIRQALKNLCWGRPEEFSTWLLAHTEANLPAFERAALQADIEEIENFIASHRAGGASSSQLSLL